MRPPITGDVPKQVDPLQQLYDAIHSPHGTTGDPSSHRPPQPSEGIEWNQRGHTIDTRDARMFKKRLESRDHVKERKAREWKSGEHGPWRQCVLCGEYKKWGKQLHGSNACPDCLPELGDAAYAITRYLMTVAGTWPAVESTSRQGAAVVFGLMALAGSFSRAA
jgi:hypothetical protein